MRFTKIRPRFSLRTLLLLSLLAASGTALWRVWEPWVEMRLADPPHFSEAASFSPDSRLLAVTMLKGAGGAPLEIWDCSSHRKLYEIADSWRFGRPAFSSDSSRVYTLEEGTFTVRNSLSGAPIQVLKMPERPDFGAISPDDRLLAAIGGDMTSVWDIESQKMLWSKTPRGSSIGFSPDNQRIAIASIDGSVVVCEAKTGKDFTAIPPAQHEMEAGFPCTAFSPDGSQLLAGNFSEKQTGVKLSMFNLPGSKAELMFQVPVMAAPRMFASIDPYSPDGHLIATVAVDGVNICDAKTGLNCAAVDWKFTYSPVERLKFFPDGRRIFILRANRSFDASWAQICDVRSGQQLFVFPQFGYLYIADLSADGRRIVLDGDRGLHLWTKQHDESFLGIAFLPEFWLTVVLAGAFIWSLVRDWRELGRK